MKTHTENAERLAMEGGEPCVVDKPDNYFLGPQEIGEEEIEAVTEVLRSQNLFRFGLSIEKSYSGRLEAAVREAVGTEYALVMNGGTSALICAMVGLGVSSGDEVIVPAYTYIATAAAVLACHAIPVISEIDSSLTLDPKELESRISDRTRLIVPVHMRGTPCRMDEILQVAEKHGIAVLEDCAQANGGFYKGKPLGAWGNAGIFSYQQAKIITTGEGGALVTDDRTVYERGACYHDSAYTFWMEGKNRLEIAPFLGQNYRMSEVNAAIGFIQMRKRDRILSRLREIKRRILAEIKSNDALQLQDMPDIEGDCAVSVVFFLKTPGKAAWFAKALRAEGMSAGSILDKEFPDRHIYYHWDYILEKRTPDRYGYPWQIPGKPCRISYSRDMCPKSIDYLQRAVAVPLTQAMSDEHVASCIKAILKVATRI